MGIPTVLLKLATKRLFRTMLPRVFRQITCQEHKRYNINISRTQVNDAPISKNMWPPEEAPGEARSDQGSVAGLRYGIGFLGSICDTLIV